MFLFNVFNSAMWSEDKSLTSPMGLILIELCDPLECKCCLSRCSSAEEGLLGVKLRFLQMLGKHSAMELCQQPQNILKTMPLLV